jgi:hypothetical protein
MMQQAHIALLRIQQLAIASGGSERVRERVTPQRWCMTVNGTQLYAFDRDGLDPVNLTMIFGLTARFHWERWPRWPP